MIEKSTDWTCRKLVSMPARRKTTKLRRIGFFSVILLLSYLGSYLALAANGGWYWSQTGKLRYSFGFSVTDVERWFPAWAHWEPFCDIHGEEISRGDLQGFFVRP
jgi:hypothetical protein